MKALRKLVGFYLHSLAFLVWSALCIIFGATWAYTALIGVLNSKGVL